MRLAEASREGSAASLPLLQRMGILTGSGRSSPHSSRQPSRRGSALAAAVGQCAVAGELLTRRRYSGFGRSVGVLRVG